MGSLQKSRSAATRPAGGATRIDFYGWDARSETWHGPNELAPSGLEDQRLLRALRGVSGKSWYGPVTGCAPGRDDARFFAVVHDLSDCGVATIYCDESKAGPAEIVAVVPARRRARLREDFVFEFLTYARFLGALASGTELQVHEAMSAAVAPSKDEATVVFSIASGLWPDDLGHELSCCVEKVVLSLCGWLT